MEKNVKTEPATKQIVNKYNISESSQGANKGAILQNYMPNE